MLPPELTVNITLNMHVDDIKDLYAMFETLPGYKKKDHLGMVYWFGEEEEDVFVVASFGAKGLSFESELPDDKWFVWMAIFLKKATEVLGYDVEVI